MSKKRRTPSSPRTPFSEEGTQERVHAKVSHTANTMLGEAAQRDTDERDLGDFHPDFAGGDDTMSGGHTEMDLPAVMIEGEDLLDLGGLCAQKLESYDELVVEPSVSEPASAEVESVERRLTPTLLKIFARKRQQIRLSLDQLSRLSGIALQHLEGFESPKPTQAITYDQTVVLARVLGVSLDELPGLRRKETRPHLGVVLAELERTMLGAPLLRFEGKHGERYGGDVERAASSKSFTVRIEDDSLEPVLPKGAILGFMSGVNPTEQGILLLRHRRSALLALRRNAPPSYVGLVHWQPAYVVGGEWHLVGSLEVILPPR